MIEKCQVLVVLYSDFRGREHTAHFRIEPEHESETDAQLAERAMRQLGTRFVVVRGRIVGYRVVEKDEVKAAAHIVPVQFVEGC